MLRWRYIGPALALVAIIAALPLVFSLPDEAAEIIERRIETLVNRPIRITGETSVELFPEPRIILNGLVLDGGEAGVSPLLTVRRVTAYPQLLSILLGDFQVRRFDLEAPKVHVAIDTDGRLNWSIYDARDFDALSIQNPHIGKIGFSDGALEFQERDASSPLTVSDIKGVLDFPRFLSAARLTAAGVMDDRALSLDLNMREPVNLLISGSAQTSIKLSSEDTTLEANGRLRTGLSSGFEGDLSFTTQNLPTLFNWIGLETDRRLLPAEVALDSQLTVLGTEASIADASMTLDGQRAEGELTFNLSTPSPSIEGTLAFETLSLDRITAQLSGPQAEASHMSSPADISEVQADTSALQKQALMSLVEPQKSWIPVIPLDQSIDLRVSARSLSLAGLTASDVAATLTVADGRADVGLGSMVIAGGQVAGAGLVQNIHDEAQASINLSMQDVALEEIFGAVSALGWIGGRMNADINLTLPDIAWPQIWSRVEGTMDLAMSDGSFQLPNAVQLVSPGLPGVVGTIAEQSLRRRSREIPMDSGALNIAFEAGTANVTLFDLRGPIGNLTGEGRVALDDGGLRLRLDAQDGNSNEGPAIPIAVSGSLNEPVASGDLAALARLFAN